jgi:hypothetical protein
MRIYTCTTRCLHQIQTRFKALTDTKLTSESAEWHAGRFHGDVRRDVSVGKTYLCVCVGWGGVFSPFDHRTSFYFLILYDKSLSDIITPFAIILTWCVLVPRVPKCGCRSQLLLVSQMLSL